MGRRAGVGVDSGGPTGSGERRFHLMTLGPTPKGGAAIPLPYADAMRDGDRLAELLAQIDAEGDPSIATQLAGYFQVRPGGYAEGDRFVGVKLSRLRQLVKPYVREPISPATLSPGLTSPIHEHRLSCLVILAEYAVRALSAGDGARLTTVYETYVEHLDYIDNWDLVDCSAPRVVGGYLLDRDRAPLYVWIRSAWCGSAGSPSSPPTGSSTPGRRPTPMRSRPRSSTIRTT